MSNPYEEGREAHNRYQARSDNPYKEGSDEYEDWDDGYSSAKYGFPF